MVTEITEITEIKRLRRQAKITQQELALASGLSEKAISMIENYKTQPTLPHWYKIRRICINGVRNEEFKDYRFIGQNIAELRRKAGISQKDLEKTLLLPATMVSAWETDKKIPSVNALCKICSYFGVRPDYFFIEDKSGIY